MKLCNCFYCFIFPTNTWMKNESENRGNYHNQSSMETPFIKVSSETRQFYLESQEKNRRKERVKEEEEEELKGNKEFHTVVIYMLHREFQKLSRNCFLDCYIKKYRRTECPLLLLQTKTILETLNPNLISNIFSFIFRNSLFPNIFLNR